MPQLGGRPRVFGRLQRQAATAAVDRAQSIAATPFQPYTGQQVAPFNATQNAAQADALAFAHGNAGQDALNQSLSLATHAGNYTPPTINATSYQASSAGAPSLVNPVSARAVGDVGYNPASVSLADAATAAPASLVTGSLINRGDIRDVTGGGSVTQAQIDAYLNPYTDEVVNTSLADIERQRQIQQALNAGEARKAHAFGGTGAAVAAGLTNDTFARTAASTAANLRSQGYTTALGAAQTDLGRQLQGQIANQGVDLATATTNAGNLQRSSEFNAGAQNQLNQFNAGQRQQVNLANTGALNTAALDASRGQLSAAQGNQQIGANLSLADAAAANRAGEFNAGAANTISLADAAARNDASRFNAGQDQAAQVQNQQAQYQAAAMALQASGALASLSDQQRSQALQAIAVAGSVGDAQQALQQLMDDKQYAEFLRAYDDIFKRQGLLNSTVFGAGVPTTATTGERNQAFNDVGSAAQALGSLDLSHGFTAALRSLF